jgi:hypothetical protein
MKENFQGKWIFVTTSFDKEKYSVGENFVGETSVGQNSVGQNSCRSKFCW